MIKENQYIKIKYDVRTFQHYKSLGYNISKEIGEINVLPQHLSKGSHKYIQIICDHCGKEYEAQFCNYIKTHDDTLGDFCSECGYKHREITNINKYGVVSPMQRDDIKEKTKQTNISKYGVSNPMQTDIIKEKQRKSFVEKYGVDNPSISKDVNNKRKNTFIQKYGVDNPFKLHEIQVKATESRLQNGKQKTSKPQKKLYNILKDIYPNIVADYQVDKYTLDYLLNIDDVQIDIEYDGWYWHNTTKQILSDNRRDSYIINLKKMKVLRIKSGNNMPTKEQIVNAIQILTQTQNTYYEVILSDWR